MNGREEDGAGTQWSAAPLSRRSVMHAVSRVSLAAAIMAGAATVFAFSPFNLFFVAFLALGGLFLLLQRCTAPIQGALLGYAFGLGMFCTGVAWLYVSLHDFGGMPAPVAVLSVFLLCAYLAVFPAVAGWLTVRLAGMSPWRFAITAASSWALTEWLRGWLLTGFPWLAMGYSQVPSSPLAGVAPIGGVYGISFVVALIAAMAAAGVAHWNTSKRVASIMCLTVIALFATTWALNHREWTSPTRAPISVSLLQGNIPQELKFVPGRLSQQLQTYLTLAEQNKAQLMVLPESAVPLLKSDVPSSYWDALKSTVPSNGDMLVGVFDDEDNGRQIFNSVINLGNTPTRTYHKTHLVPFGEFIPFKWLIGWVYTTMLNMPLSDQMAGAADQVPLDVSGEKVAVSICYEDAFGEEVIRQLPAATMLVNVSNDAWFGEHIAPWQHTQIAQTRAAETGRYMLRATNTGVTSIINHRGEVVSAIPQSMTGALRGTAQGRTGATPYVMMGNWPIVILCCALLLLLSVSSRRREPAQ